MIQLIKGPAPPLLTANAEPWTAAFLAIIERYGTYDAVPRDEFARLKHYRASEIVATLFSQSHGKCCYCEEYLPQTAWDVEHFLPKPTYPEQAFVWQNLLPICTPCNAAKANFDVGREPIVNPLTHQPERFFHFHGEHMEVHPQSPSAEISQRTLDVLQLNRPRLLAKRRQALKHGETRIGPLLPFSACLSAHMA